MGTISQVPGSNRGTVPMLPFAEECFLKLGVFTDRLHHLADRIYDDIGTVNNDEMSAILSNYLLAVLRKGQQLTLQIGILRAMVLIRADIDERFVAERVGMFLSDRVGFRATFTTYQRIVLQRRLIPCLRHCPKMKLLIAGRQFSEVRIALHSHGHWPCATGRQDYGSLWRQRWRWDFRIAGNGKMGHRK